MLEILTILGNPLSPDWCIGCYGPYLTTAWVVLFILIHALIFIPKKISTLEGISYLKNFWKHSFDFKGKTNRKVFWITQGFIGLEFLLIAILGVCIAADEQDVLGTFGIIFLEYIDWLATLEVISNVIPWFSLLFLIPSISLQIRRLRDAAKNPWWILISFVPIVGGIVLLIFYLSPSKKRNVKNKLQEKLKEVENLLSQGTIDEEEYKYMRKKILTKYVD